MKLSASKKGIINKILFIIIIVIAVLFLKSTNVKAFIMGGLDDANGNHNFNIPNQGLRGDFMPYFWQYDVNGNINLCIEKDRTVVRREGNVSKQGLTIPTAIWWDGIPNSYYNQEIQYDLEKSMQTEQSIAAGYYAYLHSNENKKDNSGVRKELQWVVWSSGQWNPANRKTANVLPNYRLATSGNSDVSTLANSQSSYVNNLLEYDKADTTETSEAQKGKITERAQAWANFKYKILDQSGGELNIQTLPQDTSKVNVLVDQAAGTFSQGPYTMNIVNSNGNILNNVKTEHYTTSGVNLGTLVYNEIMGYNSGCSIFKFCDIGTSSATITFTNGEKQSGYSIELIDDSGNVIKMPKFGQNFYVRVKVPQNETRTIKTFDYDITFNYYTNFKGTTEWYYGVVEKTELGNEALYQRFTIDATPIGMITGDGVKQRNAEWRMDKPASQMSNIKTAQDLKNYLVNEIRNHSKLPHDKKGSRPLPPDPYKECLYSTIYKVETGNGFDAWIDTEDGHWHFKWGAHNPIIYETNPKNVPDKHLCQDVSHIIEPTIEKGSSSLHFGGADCLMKIGGHVWEDIRGTKEGKLNGRYKVNDDDKDIDYAGMLVTLLDSNGKQIAQTVTDEEGKYSFEGLNALKKYTIKFTYNGQIYQDTYYKEDLSGGFSNAKESVQDRENLNNRFTNISSYPNNYEGTAGWNSAYSLKEKIKDANGNYINYGSGLLTYNDVWNEFVARVLEYKSENDPHEYAYSDLSTWLEFENNIDKSEITKIKRFIYDCMINATVRQLPEKNQFYINSDKNAGSITNAGKTFEPLYTNNYDMSQNVDFGIYKRETADLALQKDVYKATVRVNGKTHEYIYNKKDANVDDNGNWTIEVRKGDYLYNGTGSYTREIHKSDYLYDGSEIYGDANADAKNLQVYITYRIAVRNVSALYDMSVNEIVDYYNNSQFEFKDDEITKNNTYIGTRTGERKGNVNISTASSLGNNRENVSMPESSSLYITGITDQNGNARIQANGGMAYVYVTFKVKNEDNSSVSIENGRVKIDVSTEDGKANANSGKKRNASEINAYSSYYKENRNNDPALTPNTLDANNNIQDEDVSGKNAGMLDMNSNPGNLKAEDFNKDGSLNLDRIENDTDQAPYVLLKFPEDPDEPGDPDDPDDPENPNDSDERLFTGFVYEDERNQASDDAVIGDGIYNEGETPINGVTVQLVELVQEVNSEGTPTGKYLGEYVWNSIEVSEDGSMTNTAHRYFSGLENGTNSRTEPAVISGPGILAISGFEVTENGVYGFKGVPAGDFFIRFIYGDTTQTTLPNGGDVVTTLQGQATDETSGFISTTGLNAKSYNGQDYKSTIYQKNITQDTAYNKYNRVINGYKDYNNQNYEITNGGNQYLTDKPTKYSASAYVDRIASTTDGKDTSKMYYYDIAQSSTISGASDAKDVGNIRTNSNNYSKGEENIEGVSEKTLTNYRSEVLASPTKMNSLGDVGTQINMLKELMDNTAMAAQTGVINTEIEYNSDKTVAQGENNKVSYVLDGIDFGLTERPRAQLQMDKRVSNVTIKMQDGKILFDSNKSVDNLPYMQHKGHDIKYSNSIGGAYRLEEVNVSNTNTTTKPELIAAYLDEEIGTEIEISLTYELKVINVGEVDYLDNQFYYTGKTSNPDKEDNISHTTAYTIVDYVSNNIRFGSNDSNNAGWSVRTVDQLTGHENNELDLINSKYKDTLNTYSVIITTNNLSTKELMPKPNKPEENEKSYVTTKLILNTSFGSQNQDASRVYNNLAEIVQVSNEQGRRMEFSIVGNQPMANQSLGTDVSSKPEEGIYTKEDLVEPTEIDADSSQKVLVDEPYGDNRNYALWIGLGILVAILIGGSIFLIKKKVLNNK